MTLKALESALRNDDYRKALTLILICFAVVLFVGVGLRSPWPADEPRFAEAAREMVASGHWFFPLRGGELYPDKPPVFMWSIAFFYLLIGNIKVAFMLPNILVSLVSVWCVFDLTYRLWNVRTAKWAAFALLLAPQFILQAKSAQIDAMVAAWITIAMYGLVRHFFIRRSWCWYLVAWGFMGLGIITKGVGFLPAFLLVPILILHFSKRYDFGDAVGWKLWLGPVAMLAVVGCWLLPMVYIANHSGNPDFIAYKDDILFRQTMKRYAHSWTHLQPWYYFLFRFPILWFPLPFFLLNRVFWKKICDVRGATLLVWIALVLLFFSSTPGKREVYILPALPMLAVVVAPYLARETVSNCLIWLINILLVAISLLVGIVGVLGVMHVHAVVKVVAKQGIEPSVLFPLLTDLGLMLIAGALVALVILFIFRKSSALIRMGMVSCWGWIWFSLVGYPLINPIRTAAVPIMKKAAKHIGPNGQLGLVAFKEQFLLASPVPITQFSYLASRTEQLRNAWLWMSERSNRFILLPAKAGEQVDCFHLSKGVNLGTGYRNHWWLLSATALDKSCPRPDEIKRYHMSK
ncbi:MAG: Undecaprenyl phosphate-alpha-4-amino-4-deoxy-L-arabinose arabinosyl transferase [Candidatus Celerinatantimonas neptuna]|nr:MAG: Undecaprenyl phosphate-alpha-4-amino-4-deoxy-L-arabinose arabinosyl transferase [Candidatus Celerinatantimonas neptuna]